MIDHMSYISRAYLLWVILHAASDWKWLTTFFTTIRLLSCVFSFILFKVLARTNDLSHSLQQEGFSPVCILLWPSDCDFEQMTCRIPYNCSASLLFVFFHVSADWLPEKMTDHIPYNYMASLLCAFFHDSSNRQLAQMTKHILYRCRASLLCVFFQAVSDGRHYQMYDHIPYKCMASLLCVFFHVHSEHEGLFSSVYSFIPIQMVSITKWLTAFHTVVWLVSCVDPFIFI